MENMTFGHRVAGLSLHDMVKTLMSWEGADIGLLLLNRNRSQNEKLFRHRMHRFGSDPAATHSGFRLNQRNLQ